jgi:hypothetical protein
VRGEGRRSERMRDPCVVIAVYRDGKVERVERMRESVAYMPCMNAERRVEPMLPSRAEMSASSGRSGGSGSGSWRRGRNGSRRSEGMSGASGDEGRTRRERREGSEDGRRVRA